MRENYQNQYYSQSEDGCRDFELMLNKELALEELMNDVVYQSIGVTRFESCSKGRDKKGKKRLRKFPLEVTRLRYYGKTFFMTEKNDGKGPLDSWATEILGDTIEADRALDVFLERIERIIDLQFLLKNSRLI